MEANQPFEIRTSLDDENCLRVAVLGEIDLLGAREAEERLFAERDGHRRVILDLRDVTFMGAGGIGLLVRAHVRSAIEGRRLTVIDGGHVHTLLDMAGLLGVLDIIE